MPPRPAPFYALRSTLPTYQIFAANTGVGKTVLSAALCRAATKVPLHAFEKRNGNDKSRRVYYVKPVQTGFPVDSDARHVQTFCPDAATNVIFTYREPAGAHLTAVREDKPVSDVELLRATQDVLDGAWKESAGNAAIAFLETAGGVNSPVMSGTLQCEAYRPLRLPTLLIGDANLGGVSTTLSAYESLYIRGYDITGIVMFDSMQYQNHHAIRKNIDPSVPVYIFSPPPPFPVSRSQEGPDVHEKMLDATNMMVYYENSERGAMEVVQGLLDEHWNRVTRLEDMAADGEKSIWWPFTQHGDVGKPTVIDSAHQEFFTTYQSGALASSAAPSSSSLQVEGTTTPQYDACASWWTQSFGHANTQLTLAAAHASGRYGHVIFPECIHEPALKLSEKILSTVGRGWGSRVFYSDNGSTAIEVAIKAALKKTEKDMKRNGTWQDGRTLGVVGIEGSYHGDTIGSMDACGPNVYNEEINWYKPRGLWFAPPTIVFKNGQYTLRLPPSLQHTRSAPTFQSLSDVFSLDRTDLLEVYCAHIQQTLAKYLTTTPLGALIIEPLLLGAGGMAFIDPLFQRILIRAVRALDQPLPVIYDEVFVGFHRLGLGIHSPGTQLLGEYPDLACYAKCMTGGLVPLAATVVKEEIFEVFKGEGKKEALLHGHSYTAHPVGCAVGVRTLEMFEEMGAKAGGVECLSRVWDEELTQTLSNLPTTDGVISLGSVLAIELSTTEKGYASHVSAKVISKLREHGLYTRPLGNVIYIMAPVVAVRSEKDREVLKWVADVLVDVLSRPA
ncbi:hypothetical protein SpCBS45565_g01925 [Spizellomyces sp. 'palustris']|nr:hypothetical protein SpCBS45565_g01925 [Spizellomyces sp. 'palustris']